MASPHRDNFSGQGEGRITSNFPGFQGVRAKTPPTRLQEEPEKVYPMQTPQEGHLLESIIRHIRAAEVKAKRHLGLGQGAEHTCLPLPEMEGWHVPGFTIFQTVTDNLAALPVQSHPAGTGAC